MNDSLKNKRNQRQDPRVNGCWTLMSSLKDVNITIKGLYTIEFKKNFFKTAQKMVFDVKEGGF